MHPDFCLHVNFRSTSASIADMSLPIKGAMSKPMTRLRVCLFVSFALTLSIAAHAEQRLLKEGARRLSIDCDGKPGTSPTVVLMAGGGRTSMDWAKVLPAVTGFARVCGYD